MTLQPKRMKYAQSGLSLLVLLLSWMFWFGPLWLKLPDFFHYEADIISRDNFYDEKQGDFLGIQISKTRFGFEVMGKEKGVLLINNFFDVRTITGDKIFKVERKYGIDPKSKQHVPGFGDKDRSGYLFAPKRSKKENFTYWHVNYDTPAEMIFKEEEVISGLPVYLYEANYTADQTNNLGHLPGVPEERGITLDINLRLWVEPVSGWLVKYQDKTIAYYYDIKTGKRLNPWNEFTNTYTDSSVNLQIQEAKTHKQKIVLTEIIIPLLGGLLVFSLFTLAFLPKHFSEIYAGIICLMGGLVIIGWHTHSTTLIQILPDFVPMQYNTALCFILCGMAILALSLRRGLMLVTLGSLVSFVGLLTLAQYVFQVSLGIDQLFLHAYTQAHTFHPGRMAPNTALCFALSGFSFISLGLFSKYKLNNLITTNTSWVLLGLSTIALFGYMFALEPAYRWGSSTNMALHTSLGFCLIGVALLQLQGSRQKNRFRLPAGIGVGTLVVTICLSFALKQKEKVVIDDIIENQAREMVHLLRLEIGSRIKALHMMALRWETLKGTPHEVWEKEAAQYFQDFPGFQALEWVDSSYIVRWIFPLRGNEKAQDLDLSFNQERFLALKKSQKTKQPVITRTVELVQGGTGFLLVVPIHTDDVFQGFILGVFKVKEFLNIIFQNFSPQVAVYISEAGKEIYRHRHFASKTTGDFKLVKEFHDGGLDWTLLVEPSPKLLSEGKSLIPLVTLIVGSGFAGLLVISITLYRISQIRAIKLERENEIRKIAEKELQRSNNDLEQFAYVASHDLKTPLRAINNYSQWIVEDASELLPAKSREHLQKIQSRIGNMQALLDDLLTYSRAGRIEGEIVKLETAILISEVIEFISPPDGFKIGVQGELPIIHAARAPIELVFRNLIENAIKHHNKQNGNVWISASEIKNRNQFEFVVSDDGPGINPEYHEKVFQMFQRLKSGSDVEGTGMGLAIVKRIVEDRGGRIELDSAEGKGAAFRFTWQSNMS